MPTEPSDMGDNSESDHLILESQQLTSAPVGSWWERESQMVDWDKKRQRNCLGSREGDSISHVLHHWLYVLQTVLLMQYDLTYHKCGNLVVCSGTQPCSSFWSLYEASPIQEASSWILFQAEASWVVPLYLWQSGSSGPKLTFPQHCGASLIFSFR